MAQKASRLIGAVSRLAQECRLRLTRAERGIPDLPTLLGTARQRLDDRTERAMLALPALVERRRAVLTAVERRLPDPRTLTAAARETLRDRGLRLKLAAPGLVVARRSGLDLLSQRLIGAAHRAVTVLRGRADRVTGRLTEAPLRASLREARAHLSGLGPRLDAASPLAILQRGYVLVTDPVGQPVTSAASVKPQARLRLHFGDGEVDAVAQGNGTGRSRAKGGQDAPKPEGTGKARAAVAQEQLDL
jgi:exodeoxyribonuclease VII large subunit